MNGAAPALLCAGLLAVAPAQQFEFQETWRWTWHGGYVRSAALLPDGDLVALGVGAPEGGNCAVVVYDAAARRELHRWPVPSQLLPELRFVDTEHIDVRLPDSDAFLSGSHWRRLRIADGVLGDARRAHRPADWPDPTQGEPRSAELAKLDHRELVRYPGDHAIVRDYRGGALLWHRGLLQPLSDCRCEAIAWTRTGRHLVMQLSTRVVAVPIAGGEPWDLPVSIEKVDAIAGGPDGDDVLVVTARNVLIYSPTIRRETRRIHLGVDATAGARVNVAALAPHGRMLAVGCTDGSCLLLDLGTGKVTNSAPIRLLSGSELAWSPEGSVLCVTTQNGIEWLTPDGAQVACNEHASNVGVDMATGPGWWRGLLAIDEEACLQTGPRCVELIRRNGDPVEFGTCVARPIGRLSPGTVLVLENPNAFLLANRKLNPQRFAVRDLDSWDLLGQLILPGETGPMALCSAPPRLAAVIDRQVVVWQLTTEKPR